MQARLSYQVHLVDVESAHTRRADFGLVDEAPLPRLPGSSCDDKDKYYYYGRQPSGCNEIARAYAEGSAWLFYGTQPPGCKRISLAPPSQLKNGLAASLLIHEASGAGVYSMWQRFGQPSDALAIKGVPNVWDCFADAVNTLPFNLETLTERTYPFLAVQLDEPDPIKYCRENADDVARVLTGHLESEDPETLKRYVETSISYRSYERLFFRWTDALAIYSSRVECPENPEFLLWLIARGVQVFELCVLLRRMLLNLARDADKLSRRLWRPHPLAVHRQLNGLAEVQHNSVVALPLSSVEAKTMFAAARRQFGLEDALEAAHGSCALLENRERWAEAKWLALLGFITYLADKLGLFQHIASHW